MTLSTLLAGFKVQGSGFRAQGSGFRDQSAGCRVQGVWFKVQGVEDAHSMGMEKSEAFPKGLKPCEVSEPKNCAGFAEYTVIGTSWC